ncbi:MAG: ATP-binding cassette domain-containing protein [Hyphomicrobiales bacterium]
MSATADKGPLPGKALQPNPVHAFRANLQSAFGGGGTTLSEPADASPFETALRDLLRALDWSGTEHQLAELMPYLDRMDTTAQLLAVMHHLGYRCIERNFSAAPNERRAFPAFAVLDTGEPVVITGQNERGAYLIRGTADGGQPRAVNPGRRTITAYSFLAIDPETQDPQWKKNWYLSALAAKSTSYSAIILLSFVINVLGLFVPIYVMMMYNYMIPTQSVDTIVYMFAVGAIVVGLEIYFKRQRSQIVAHAGAHFVTAISTATFAKLLDLPLSMTQSAPISSQIARLKQFSNVKDFFAGQLASTAFDVPFTLVFLIAMIVMGGSLAFIPVILIAALSALVALANLPMSRASDETGLTGNRLQAFQFESLDLRQLIRENAAVDAWRTRYSFRLRDALQARYRSSLYNFALNTFAQMLVMMAGVLTLVIGAGRVMDGTLSSGGLIASMMIVWRLLSPIQIALLATDRIVQFARIVRQINAMMRLEPEAAGTAKGTQTRREPLGYSLVNVSLRYPRATNIALRGITIDIQPGQSLAIAGPSSSGKSTLLKVCLGLWHTQSGNVLIDGVDLRQIEPRVLRRTIGYVPQYLQFIHGSLRDNLTLGAPAVEPARLSHALDLVGIAEHGGYFSQGLDTRLTGDEWAALPNGLRQQIALARAVAREAPVYLLDEPGTFIDGPAEERFRATFAYLKENATVIMVTNRPSHMVLCDRAILLNQGAIAADGTPDQVIGEIRTKARNAS